MLVLHGLPDPYVSVLRIQSMTEHVIDLTSWSLNHSTNVLQCPYIYVWHHVWILPSSYTIKYDVESDFKMSSYNFILWFYRKNFSAASSSKLSFLKECELLFSLALILSRKLFSSNFTFCSFSQYLRAFLFCL